MEISILKQLRPQKCGLFLYLFFKVDYNINMIIKCFNCKKEINISLARIKRSKNIHCSRECYRQTAKKIVRSDDFKKKVSLGMKGVNTWAAGKKRPLQSGENSYFWKGGVSKINRTERQNYTATLEYKEFRRAVLKRDNYTCQICGARTKLGKRILIQIDHIKPFSLFPELRMDMNNVRTLCKPCHYKTDTFGAKVYRYKI